MIEAIESPDVEMAVSESNYDEKVEEVYPTTEEEVVNFLNRFKLKGSKLILCPRCNTVFDKEATEGLKGNKPQLSRRGK